MPMIACNAKKLHNRPKDNADLSSKGYFHSLMVNWLTNYTKKKK